MNCDRCSRPITEDNTYERILCYGCTHSEPLPEHKHCGVCGSKILYHKLVSNTKKLLTKLRPYVIPISLVAVLISALLVIQVPIITKLVVGAGCVIAAGIAIVLAAILLFPGISTVGDYVIRWFDWKITDEVGTWFIGLLSVSSPAIVYLVYLLGSLVLKHSFGMP